MVWWWPLVNNEWMKETVTTDTLSNTHNDRLFIYSRVRLRYKSYDIRVIASMHALTCVTCESIYRYSHITSFIPFFVIAVVKNTFPTNSSHARNQSVTMRQYRRQARTQSTCAGQHKTLTWEITHRGGRASAYYWYECFSTSLTPTKYTIQDVARSIYEGWISRGIETSELSRFRILSLNVLRRRSCCRNTVPSSPT